jgi:hypothetical protein
MPPRGIASISSRVYKVALNSSKKDVVMNTGLTEQEMRNALGLDIKAEAAPEEPEQRQVSPPAATPKPKKRASTGLRVTLRVTREFEGEESLFVHDANTLSRFDAEQLARKAATKEKYRFFELVSIGAIGQL